MRPRDIAPSAPSAAGLHPPRRTPRRGLLARMRIRKKLLVIHTIFTLALAALLLVVLRPAADRIVLSAESHKAEGLLRTLLAESGVFVDSAALDPRNDRAEALLPLHNVQVRVGAAPALGIDPAAASRAVDAPGEVLQARLAAAPAGGAIAFLPSASNPPGRFISLTATIPEVRDAAARLYALTFAALLAMYVLVALGLELFVLPRHVYLPIRRMLAADEAVLEGRTDDELVPASAIPADELGEIMRSRNESVIALRRQGAALADALSRLETVATDLKRKNHLLETARRNLADAERLAVLGVMSAGIAHELNTPLAVLKGLVEQLNRSPGPRPALDRSHAELMLRVLRRLERLSESLLDFARVRPPVTAPADLHALVDEARTLVRLDRGAPAVEIDNRLPDSLLVECDADRIVQVLVNLIRNSVDALRARRDSSEPPRIVVEAQPLLRDGESWVSLTIADNGPGIDPAVLERLFEPFVSTRLDSRGTGLGLAVAEGIVREHGGVILARNLPGRAGAVFEVVLPLHVPARAAEPSLAPVPGALQEP